MGEGNGWSQSSGRCGGYQVARRPGRCGTYTRPVIGLILGIVILAIVVIALLLVGRAQSDGGFERIVRCRAGHLFTTTLIPGASLKAVRLWKVRFERCPVGRHWTIVAPVDVSTLTPDEIAAARSHHDIRVP